MQQAKVRSIQRPQGAFYPLAALAASIHKYRIVQGTPGSETTVMEVLALA
jgi:hypothetical protein